MKKLLLNACTIVCVILCILLNNTISAQVVNEKRIEIDLEDGFENFNLTPFGKDGILMYAREEDGDYWKVERYDTELVPGAEKKLEVTKKFGFSKQFESETQLSLLFTDRKGNYILYKINADDLAVSKQTGKFPTKKIYVKELIVSGDLAYISAGTKKGPVLMSVDMGSGKKTIIPTTISPYGTKDLSIENMQVMKSGEVMVYINALNKRDLNVYVMQLDDLGKKTNTFNLSANTEKKLTSISASPVSNEGYIFTGTYSTKSTTGSEGMYICKTTGETVDFLQFYNFLDFEEFLSYLPEKKQEKIEKKKERKEDNDKEFSINYYIAEHEIIEMNDQYIFIGEAFYPTYRTETKTTYVNGKPTTTTTTVFDGYYYTHATAVGFTMEGEKLWDRTFEMRPGYKPYSVRRFISVSTQDDVISLLFSSGNSIKSIAFSPDGGNVKEKSIDFIKEKSDEEKIKASYSNMQYWYDNHFIAHGYQTIKDKEESFGNKKRKVYFITKINYE
ncbi:MAG: hypothetical protein H7Y00_05145 [Fimbriimonadaceae bacterium]|nr:hypothetical protein [Chitinophagales bacterium]